MEIKNIQFKTFVLQNNSRYHSVYFEPKDKCEVINNFIISYGNINSVEKLLNNFFTCQNQNNDEEKSFGINESFIYVQNGKVKFDVEYVTEIKPIELKLESAIELFSKYLEYLTKYENCQIPGLLPKSKLKTWKAVPNEHIKDKFKN